MGGRLTLSCVAPPRRHCARLPALRQLGGLALPTWHTREHANCRRTLQPAPSPPAARSRAPCSPTAALTVGAVDGDVARRVLRPVGVGNAFNFVNGLLGRQHLCHQLRSRVESRVQCLSSPARLATGTAAGRGMLQHSASTAQQTAQRACTCCYSTQHEHNTAQRTCTCCATQDSTAQYSTAHLHVLVLHRVGHIIGIAAHKEGGPMGHEHEVRCQPGQKARPASCCTARRAAAAGRRRRTGKQPLASAAATRTCDAGVSSLPAHGRAQHVPWGRAHRQSWLARSIMRPIWRPAAAWLASRRGTVSAWRGASGRLQLSRISLDMGVCTGGVQCSRGGGG